MTTTLAAVRNGMETTLRALTPTASAAVKFVPAPRNIEIKDWALEDTRSSTVTRRFQIREATSEIEPPFLHPEERWVSKELAVTVAYFVPAFRGTDGNDDAEDTVDADADLIGDALVDGDNYVSGQNGTFLRSRSVDRTDDRVWFLDLVVLVHMQKTRNS